MRLILILAFSLGIGMAQKMLVAPYVQPGNAPILDREEQVIIWQTDAQPAEFKVEYGTSPRYGQTASSQYAYLNLEGGTRIYTTPLKDLKFDTIYYYRVLMDGKEVANARFRTRPRGDSVKFAVFGDCGAGTPQQAQIAYQVYQARPQFVLITGDNVYGKGLMSEYRTRYFPYYHTEQPSLEKGAPLIRSIPFYLAIGNHDVNGSDLGQFPDGLACFYYFSLPLNGPTLEHTVTARGSEDNIRAFKEAAGNRYPRMANYSFDYGNVHIVCLDTNWHTDFLEPALVKWLEDDLESTKQTWKIVAFHHPGFSASKSHYDDQRTRVLAPLLERLGVDLVLAGHVHNYQRTHPLRFEPQCDSSGKPVIASNGRVNGKFTLDQEFDGVQKMRANGVLYIVTGAGGQTLYDPTFTDQPELWAKDSPENWVPFTVKLISSVRSFSLIETKGRRLTLRQIAEDGRKLDEFTVTK